MGADTIQVRASHLTSGEVYEQVRERVGREEISDAAAVTIASWWQSPGSVGKHLAALASGCPVELSDLLDDIAATRPEVGMPADSVALDMLATWAINFGGEDA